ncbi:rhodanese-like domain-containing protein [Thalassotalea sp. ND16A]|uniref:rhodanese-like domain-containing protein n=1 Tax=Thalassotalea sp. ND16A TaxID=1535422 RepID=UPI00051DCE3F|nr:rhodanese-like domain-containing protein [Thalassotalea sp. ND16A]KGJ99320.1 hypothetical protein ND16A_3841 [Thalassotalea sp. ND16A]
MFQKCLALLFMAWLSACANQPDIAALPAEVEQQQLLSMQQTNEQWLLLDVRSDEEYQAGYIEGAVNISHLQLGDKMSSIAQYKDKNIIVYCRSGRRAGIAIKLLQDSGFHKVSHLSGDMNGWQAANLPTVSNKQ